MECIFCTYQSLLEKNVMMMVLMGILLNLKES